VAVQVLLPPPQQQQGHAATQTDLTQQQQQPQQQRGVCDSGQGVDSEEQLLLEAARQEVLRLQELNQQLMQAHARGEAARLPPVVAGRSLLAVLATCRHMV
jgi:hypothetical protein